MASLGPSFPVSFGIVSGVFITRIIVCNKVKVVFALAASNLFFFFCPFLCGSALIVVGYV